MSLAFLSTLILFGVTAILYNGLPERLPLHFNAHGEVDLVASKVGLLVVPTISALTTLINGFLGFVLHHRERFATYLLQAASLATQVVLWVSFIGIVGR